MLAITDGAVFALGLLFKKLKKWTSLVVKTNLAYCTSKPWLKNPYKNGCHNDGAVFALRLVFKKMRIMTRLVRKKHSSLLHLQCFPEKSLQKCLPQ
jgi:hypothetical protein